MATTASPKIGLQPLVWMGKNPPLLRGNASGVGALDGQCYDMRNDNSRDPWVYFNAQASMLDVQTANFLRYNPVYDSWDLLFSTGNTFPLQSQNTTDRVNSFLKHLSSRGPRGTIAAGATTTSIPLTTALPATVAAMQLATKGAPDSDGVVRGFKIRIIDNAAGASGKTEESFIVANTSGTTPTLTISPALTFSPTNGSAYEILSGRVIGLCGTASNNRMFDIATGFISTPSSTNAPALSTDADAIWLDEAYVPLGFTPGLGFLNSVVVATAAAAGTITGTVAGVDSALAANRFRNRQIRITKDVTTPTAVGQRRKITSHTAGPSPVYTLASNWTVTPTGAGTEFVIEYPNELVVVQGGAVTMYSYAIDANGSLTADTWSAGGIWANRPNAGVTGMQMFASFGITPDAGVNVHEGLIYFMRGQSYSIDVLDIGAAATGTWTTLLAPDHIRAFTTASVGVVPSTTSRNAYNPMSLGGRYVYISMGNTIDVTTFVQVGRYIAIFDVYTRQWLGAFGIPVAANQSNPVALYIRLFIDGATSIATLGVCGSQVGTNSNLSAFHLTADLFF